ncbi:hypothetical protein C8J55DRAFT_558634 [Lentinula edodes]|uniref:Uncharacterized protein n=1 Tax=Lentinula lateritia TaxID=40482 RepID=A0A9W9DUB9_9AGAR|nr:hypothetical protein C8J55DRAFT_558634 [Lentinula edodes]
MPLHFQLESSPPSSPIVRSRPILEFPESPTGAPVQTGSNETQERSSQPPNSPSQTPETPARMPIANITSDIINRNGKHPLEHVQHARILTCKFCLKKEDEIELLDFARIPTGKESDMWLAALYLDIRAHFDLIHPLDGPVTISGDTNAKIDTLSLKIFLDPTHSKYLSQNIPLTFRN